MKPHKHRDLIKAWADGAEIEVRNTESGVWMIAPRPSWYEHMEYRLKPKPDSVLFARAALSRDDPEYAFLTNASREVDPHNLRLTFDGETGKLKAAEVL